MCKRRVIIIRLSRLINLFIKTANIRIRPNVHAFFKYVLSFVKRTLSSSK